MPFPLLLDLRLVVIIPHKSHVHDVVLYARRVPSLSRYAEHDECTNRTSLVSQAHGHGCRTWVLRAVACKPLVEEAVDAFHSVRFELELSELAA